MIVCNTIDTKTATQLTTDSWLCDILAYPEPICAPTREYIMRSHIPAHFTKIAVIIEYQP